MANRCDLCDRPGAFPNRGRLTCLTCADGEIQHELRTEGLAIIEDGRPTTYRLGYVTPRAWRYR